jgi:hypothetical protein
MTYDQGREMAQHAEITQRTGMVKPSIADAAVTSLIFTSIRSQLVRSTSVPTDEALALPLIR